MSKTFTLDSFRDALDAEFGSTFIDDVELVNPLRLPKEKREALSAAMTSLKEEDADREAAVSEVIVLAARSEAKGKGLVKACAGDLALLFKVLEAYTKGTQAGEASASQD